MPWSDPAASDKHTWHRYSRFYQRHFATLGPVSSILEFGVFKGASIAWLRAVFPDAEIVGVDILPLQHEWPTGSGITYITTDQGDRPAIARMLNGLNRRFDLVIDDGSHIPQHQANCLAETVAFLRPGGLYILEDLHTSHPQHPYYRQHCLPGTPTCLHFLLLIEHARAAGKAIESADLAALAHPDLLTATDLQQLAAAIAAVDIYQRATLPLRCHACGRDDFDPIALVCRCGVSFDIVSPDSISAALRAR
jgi:predicted O-methyltransferase YrrM